MLEFLLAIIIVALIAVGYLLGWSDAKQQARDFALIDKLIRAAQGKAGDAK